jgi:acetoin:2,6-dichlorophenolindophenol oxidoreductase subunit alpha
MVNPNPQRLIELFRTMLRIRLCEEAAARLFNEGLIFGTVHLSIGQEATPAGVCHELQATDFVTCTHRGHGWAIAKGMPLNKFFGELFGREGGACHGRGGSMHLCDADVGHIGASGIVGGGLPIAVGAAYAAQLKGQDAVAVAAFGDGATNIGTFHESVNLAAVWRLPVIFVCENNMYGEFTAATETCLIENLADRACAYGIPGVVVDGNDAEAVNDVVKTALKLARSGGGPTLIEAKTYRHRGHSRNDPAVYRPKDELAGWLQRDPIDIARAGLIKGGILDEPAVQRLASLVEQEVASAIEDARNQPFPNAADVADYTYAESVGVTS